MAGSFKSKPVISYPRMDRCALLNASSAGSERSYICLVMQGKLRRLGGFHARRRRKFTASDYRQEKADLRTRCISCRAFANKAERPLGNSTIQLTQIMKQAPRPLQEWFRITRSVRDWREIVVTVLVRLRHHQLS